MDTLDTTNSLQCIVLVRNANRAHMKHVLPNHSYGTSAKEASSSCGELMFICSCSKPFLTNVAYVAILIGYLLSDISLVTLLNYFWFRNESSQSFGGPVSGYVPRPFEKSSSCLD